MQAFMIALVVVVIHEGFGVSFKITRQEVVFEQDAVFQGLMPALFLALGLWILRRAARMLYALCFMLYAFALQPDRLRRN